MIDLDRGVTLKIADGIEVYMYKDEPGVYRNAYGHEVSKELARRVGFDVDALAVQRKRREMIAKAIRVIDDELFNEARGKKVVVERNGYALVNIGLGRHIIEGPDGGKVSGDKALTLEEGTYLFDQMFPKGADEIAVEAEARGPKRRNPSKVAPVEGVKEKAAD